MLVYELILTILDVLNWTYIAIRSDMGEPYIPLMHSTCNLCTKPADSEIANVERLHETDQYVLNRFVK